jgi:hypothetical protein
MTFRKQKTAAFQPMHQTAKNATPHGSTRRNLIPSIGIVRS